MENLDVAQLQTAIVKAGHSWQVRMKPPGVPEHALGSDPTPLPVITLAKNIASQLKRTRVSLFKPNIHINPGVLSKDIAGSPAPGSSRPATFDWRSRGIIGDVGDQELCGSCVSFATTGLVASMAALELGTVNLHLSAADQHFLSSHGCSCGGWDNGSALNEIKNRGVTTEAVFPYDTAFDKPPKLDPGTDNKLWLPHTRSESYRAFRTYRITNFSAWTGEDRKMYLAHVGPLVCSFDVYEDFDSFYAEYYGGVYRHTGGKRRGGHAVLVVGYCDTDQAWICRNSWGAGWAGGARADGTGAGFFKIGYGECGIDDDPFFGCHGVIPPDTLPAVTAVSRGTNVIDVFAAGTDHGTYTASRLLNQPDWKGWWRVAGGAAAPGTSVYGVSREFGHLNIFTVGTDHKIYTTSWKIGDAGWKPWMPLSGGVAAPGTSVTAMTCGNSYIDAFCIGTDYRVYSTALQPGMTQWYNWEPVGTLKVAPNTSAYGVSQGWFAKLNIFAVGTDHHVYTLTKQSGGVYGAMLWQQVGTLKVAPNTSVYGVSRNNGYIDIFAVGSDYGIYTAAIDPQSPHWKGWWRIAGGTAAPNTSVFAVSRSTDKLDVFAVGTDHGIYTAAWSPEHTAWQGWWRIAGGTAAPGTSVFGISPQKDRLDVFSIGSDYSTNAAYWSPDSHGWQGWQHITSGVAEGG